MREGWDKRGIRARGSIGGARVKEAVKRRAIQAGSGAVHRRRPALPASWCSAPRTASNAVVIFALDVSGSMTAVERKLAKTFFFFALHGLRRQYAPGGGALRRAHDRSVGIPREASSSRSPAAAARMASTAFRSCSTCCTTHYEPGAVQRLSVLRVRRRERHRRPRRRPRQRCASSPRASTTSATSRLVPGTARAMRRPTCAALFAELARQRRCRSAAMPCPTQRRRAGRRSATSSSQQAGARGVSDDRLSPTTRRRSRRWRTRSGSTSTRSISSSCPSAS